MYTSYGKAKHDDEEEDCSDGLEGNEDMIKDNTNCDVDNSEEYDCNYKFNYIMTYERLERKKKEATSLHSSE